MFKQGFRLKTTKSSNSPLSPERANSKKADLFGNYLTDLFKPNKNTIDSNIHILYMIKLNRYQILNNKICSILINYEYNNCNDYLYIQRILTYRPLAKSLQIIQYKTWNLKNQFLKDQYICFITLLEKLLLVRLANKLTNTRSTIQI